jgi:SAM-dependent methyltransferase
MTAPAQAAEAPGAAEPVYGRDVSEVYDLFYRGRGQDFATEAAVVTEVVRSRLPVARSLLDVACGTGEHLRSLAPHFDDVAGLEASPAMCALAREKLPETPVHQGDMRDFRLGRAFDAVCCLTGTIGYMTDIGELDAAIGAMADHLVPGGVLVIDPWWFPETFLDGHIAHDMVRDDDRTVARVSHSTRAGGAVRHEAHYLVAEPAGIRHFAHVQSLTLFTRDDYLAALARAGCTAEHLQDAGWTRSRGLFAGVRR